MTEENKQKITVAFATAVKEQLKTSGGGWGGGNSTAVIGALVETMVGEEEIALEGFDAIRLYVGQLVNPSAFRQKLEDKGLVPAAVKGSRKSGVDVLAGL